MSFIEELKWRGLVQQASDEQLGAHMQAAPMALYSGFDPTASSLHAGSLLPIITLMRAQRAGHRPIALVGGATGMIGDPSGKSEERNLLAADEVERNVAGLRAQLGRFLDFSDGGARMVNNADWFRGVGYLDFLRDVGKHFSVNMMLAKESVRARLESAGISYTEFSYMLIQAYDFLWLYDHHQCRLQIGGSDQWGNITLGIDLIRRLRQGEAYGVTTPLLTDSSGKKFGKTEKGAVWLDAARTSPYDFYQFFLRTDDRDVGKLLRYYTFLDEKTVGELDETLRVAPERREAHHALAREVTRLVHGDEETRKAEAAAAALFAGVAGITDGAPVTELPRAELGVTMLSELLMRMNLTKSKSEARRKIEEGGVYVNDERVDSDRAIVEIDVRDGTVKVRRGKRDLGVLKIT